VAKETRVGGFAFFLSLAALLVLVPVVFLILLALLDESSIVSGAALAIGVAIGMLGCSLFVRGHWATFIHELKHAIVSNLCGNRSRGMTIGRDSGKFEYSYTKDTAHLNALIGLAPYCFPAFTLATLVVAIPLLYSYPHLYTVAAVGLGFGADISLAARDLGPHQSDLTTIRGGYPIGLLYVVLMNLLLLEILIIWATNGLAGLKFLGIGLLEAMARAVGG
jgi:hypothetical protein